jgi:hypothetical protein
MPESKANTFFWNHMCTFWDASQHAQPRRPDQLGSLALLSAALRRGTYDLKKKIDKFHFFLPSLLHQKFASLYVQVNLAQYS